MCIVGDSRRASDTFFVAENLAEGKKNRDFSLKIVVRGCFVGFGRVEKRPGARKSLDDISA